MDLSEALGATGGVSIQCLTLYIPDRTSDGDAVINQRAWVEQAAVLLTRIGGGVTILPAVEGGWMNESGEIVWEHPVLVYTYIKPTEFRALLTELREFLHRLGRETSQGEVAFEFDGHFYRITQFNASA